MKKLLFLSCIIIFSACKKEPETIKSIAGIISNSDGSPASDVNLKLLYQEIGTGTYSSAYNTAGTVLSRNDGSYSIEFDAPRATSYKYQLSSPMHFYKESTENAETVGGSNTRNFTIDAYSWLAIRIKNTSPLSAGDQIIYQNISESGSCSECCDNSVFVFQGTSVDTTIICLRPTGNQIKFKWTVTKGTTTAEYLDSVSIMAYDTLVYNLYY